MIRFLIPEVIQTSALDCGPASLKALLAGFRRPVDYGRLREACQTGRDGTSIDTIESVACLLGLDAEQIILPVDHLLIKAARALPAIVVVTLPNGLTHFVVIWRRVGTWLQIMDPAVGRRWVPAAPFLNDVYRHSTVVPAADLFEFLVSDDFTSVLRARLAKLGLSPPITATHWKPIATFDAAARFLDSMVSSGGIRQGAECRRLFHRLILQPALIPEHFWTFTEHAGEQVQMRGAVLVRVKGKHAMAANLDHELSAAVEQSNASPGAELLSAFVRHSGLLFPLLALAFLVAAAGTFFEALLFRGLLDFSATLALAGQRLAAMAALLLFSAGLLSLEIPIFSLTLRLGRQLEQRFRIRFLEKLPRIADRYFQSRPIADFAERSHVIHRLRHLPHQLRRLIVAILQLLFTSAGIAWLQPRAWPLVCLAFFAALIPLFTAHSVLAAHDMRVRTHSGSLMRFYLDAMLGLIAIRAHGAAAGLRREHDQLLGDWALAGARLQRAIVSAEAWQLLSLFGVVVALLLSHTFQGAAIGRVLLIAYWALNLPVLGQEIATLTRQYPHYRSITLRLLEPLGAPEETSVVSPQPHLVINHAPSIDFRNVAVQVSGHTILSGINLRLEPGTQVAIVGPSGAGKSSLIGLLLGWLQPSSGEIQVNGSAIDYASLRLATAWVDPAVQLWNRSLQDNLTYGAGAASFGLLQAIEKASLRGVLDGLPAGLQTKLGENGGLVSGGEGQRVRFGRALARRRARLLLLDEPFRGLDIEKRRELLAKAREHWRGATLLCVTHDLSETQNFDRVLVIEQGRIVEDAPPQELKADPASRYSQLLDAEIDVRSQLWQSRLWRRLQMKNGLLTEESQNPGSAIAKKRTHVLG